MPGIRFHLLAPVLLMLAGLASAQSGPAPDPELRAAFLAEATGKYGLPAEEVEDWLARASYRQSIVNAMARPAEAVKPWKDYRPIFLTGKRSEEHTSEFQSRENLV